MQHETALRHTTHRVTCTLSLCVSSSASRPFWPHTELVSTNYREEKDHSWNVAQQNRTESVAYRSVFSQAVKIRTHSSLPSSAAYMRGVRPCCTNTEENEGYNIGLARLICRTPTLFARFVSAPASTRNFNTSTFSPLAANITPVLSFCSDSGNHLFVCTSHWRPFCTLKSTRIAISLPVTFCQRFSYWI